MNLRDIKRWSKKGQQPEPPLSPGWGLAIVAAVVIVLLIARAMTG